VTNVGSARTRQLERLLTPSNESSMSTSIKKCQARQMNRTKTSTFTRERTRQTKSTMKVTTAANEQTAHNKNKCTSFKRHETSEMNPGERRSIDTLHKKTLWPGKRSRTAGRPSEVATLWIQGHETMGRNTPFASNPAGDFSTLSRREQQKQTTTYHARRSLRAVKLSKSVTQQQQQQQQQQQ